jgi:hypothetical protein
MSQIQEVRKLYSKCPCGCIWSSTSCALPPVEQCGHDEHERTHGLWAALTAALQVRGTLLQYSHRHPLPQKQQRVRSTTRRRPRDLEWFLVQKEGGRGERTMSTLRLISSMWASLLIVTVFIFRGLVVVSV